MLITLGDGSPLYQVVVEKASKQVISVTKVTEGSNNINNQDGPRDENGDLKFDCIQSVSRQIVVDYMQENQITDPNDYMSQFD